MRGSAWQLFPSCRHFNHDSTVHTADYVVRRKTGGSPERYNTLRSHFGQTAGSGLGAITDAAVPDAFIDNAQ